MKISLNSTHEAKLIYTVVHVICTVRGIEMGENNRQEWMQDNKKNPL